MEIRLNGEKIMIENATLLEVILGTGFDKTSLVAELNCEVIKQENWQDTIIQDGDQIELLSFVGGG